MAEINNILIGNDPVKEVFLGTVPIKGVMLGNSYVYAEKHNAFVDLYTGIESVSYSIAIAGNDIIRETIYLPGYTSGESDNYALYSFSSFKRLKINNIPHGALLHVEAYCGRAYWLDNSPVYPINSVITAQANFEIYPNNGDDYCQMIITCDQQCAYNQAFYFNLYDGSGRLIAGPINFSETRSALQFKNIPEGETWMVEIIPVYPNRGFTQLESIIYNSEEVSALSGNYPIYVKNTDSSNIYINLKRTPDSTKAIELSDVVGTLVETDVPSTVLASSLTRFIPEYGTTSLKYGQGLLRISGFIPSDFQQNGYLGRLPVGYCPANPVSFEVSWTTFWDLSGVSIWKPWDTTRSPKTAKIMIDSTGGIYSSMAGVFVQETLTLPTGTIMKRPYYEISSVNFEVAFDNDGTVRAVRDFNTIYN